MYKSINGYWCDAVIANFWHIKLLIYHWIFDRFTSNKQQSLSFLVYRYINVDIKVNDEFLSNLLYLKIRGFRLSKHNTCVKLPLRNSGKIWMTGNVSVYYLMGFYRDLSKSVAIYLPSLQILVSRRRNRWLGTKRPAIWQCRMGTFLKWTESLARHVTLQWYRQRFGCAVDAAEFKLRYLHNLA